MSPYQSLKIFLVETFHLSKADFHFLLGGLVYILAIALFRKKFTLYQLLVVPILFAITLEVLDFRDAIIYAEDMDWSDSIRDILLTITLSVTLAFLSSTKQKFNKS